MSLVVLVPSLCEAAASADQSPTGAAHSRQAVCARAASRHAKCHTQVVTASDGVGPVATTSYSSGYSTPRLRTAYALPTSSTAMTVAIVDAFASPSAAADLAVYRNQFGLGTAALTQVNQSGGGPCLLRPPRRGPTRR